ncbi:putative UDP-rhamnose:rhamnosyltransferase 1 [Phalaenopsis equestris]|uniref:putative UDP-rhamnose:rhamnosyltransferase 1 n=1 Tax=Phalaenopsis equestris TaxID=78828 RepID=UPI0009E284D6|nr:putative UDP-rhamnose:rhamnosyltransferase 1 [Phalaenopsis equestris]
MEDGSLHILMLPWLAFGHLLPFLELSKSFALKGHRITFLTTPRNVARLPKISPPISHLINFLQLPLPQIDHPPPLPQNAEATIDLPSDHLRPYLRKAFDSLGQKLSDLIQNKQISSPDCIVFDYAAAAYWVPPIAAKFGVPCIFFALHNAAALSFFGPPSSLLGGAGARSTAEEFTVLPSWITFPSTIAYSAFEARKLFDPSVIPDASGVSESYRFGKSIQGCQLVLISSCKDLESEWLQLLDQIYEKPVVPVGLLPPSTGQGWHEAFEWLDKQDKGSVAYVSFVSEVKLSAAQVKEIAIGLEESELPFVWALRTESVPVGLVERIKHLGRGLVCLDWVPQIRILSHASVGGFLTHGGWSSIVEGLGFGLAMVVLPMMFDQGLNARHMVEKGLAVEVPRKEDDGSFTRDGIAKSLRFAMVEDEGNALRKRAKECVDLFGDKELHDLYVSQSIERIRRLVVSAYHERY